MARRQSILTRNKYIFFLAAILIVGSCDNQTQTTRYAQYLAEEKRLREEIVPGNMLQDSLKAMREKYKVEPGIELSRLKDRPAEWLVLLRKLKRG